MKRDPEQRLTDAELREFAAGAGSPAMQSAARELTEVRARLASPEGEVRRFILAELCERLLAEGYIRVERAFELRERAKNLQAGNGFLTDVEIGADFLA